VDTENRHHYSSYGSLEMITLAVHSLFISHNKLEEGDVLVSPTTTPPVAREGLRSDRCWCLCDTLCRSEGPMYAFHLLKEVVTA